MRPYPARTPAQSLELMLYACPHCRCLESMVSWEDRLTCKSCGYQTRINEFGFFQEEPPYPLYFDNARDWRVFCDRLLRDMLEKRYAGDEVVFIRQAELLREKEKGGRFRRWREGECRLYPGRFLFKDRQGELEMPFCEIRGLNVTKKNCLDFYFEGTKYRLRPMDSCVSALPWESAFHFYTDAAKLE